MHWEQTQFIRSVQQFFPSYFTQVSVLEIGSYDVNGSVRSLFDATKYVGVDLVPGPCVDVVCSGHEFRSDDRFDVAISTECFEHNPFYAETFLNMARRVRPGGIVLFTCAGEGRPEHGTRRCDPSSSPGTLKLAPDYYHNLTEAHFASLDLTAWFSEYRFYRNEVSHDLYFLGIRLNVEQMKKLGDHCALVERISKETEVAFSLFGRGETEAALKCMQTICDEAPQTARDHVLAQQGWLLLNAKQGDAAEAAVRRALTLSDAADLHWQLANILHVLGRSAEAVEPAARAVELAPNNSKFLYFLGAMLQGQTKLQEAEKLLKQAIQIEPTLAAAHLQLSMVYVKMGNWSDAYEFAVRAVSLAPGNDSLRLHLEKLESRRLRDENS